MSSTLTVNAAVASTAMRVAGAGMALSGSSLGLVVLVLTVFVEELDDGTIEQRLAGVRLLCAHHDDRYGHRDVRFSDARGDVLFDGDRKVS